jgi:hypothetical protein
VAVSDCVYVREPRLLVADGEFLARLKLAASYCGKKHRIAIKQIGHTVAESAANFWRHQHCTNFLVGATECSPLWETMTAMRMEFAARVIELLLQVQVHLPLL